MTRKIKLLIFASILGLLALSTVQGFLIYNTYQLEKDSFLNETIKTISKINDYSYKLDSIEDIWEDVLLKAIENTTIKRLQKKEALQKLRRITDSINPIYIKQFNKELAEKNLKSPIKFHKTLKEIVVFNSIMVDTIFVSNKEKEFHLLGEKFSNKTSHKINSSIWKNEHQFDKIINNKKQKVIFTIQLKAEDFMNIDGWKSIVFKRMLTLLLASLLIFTFVIGLLFLSIKNLIFQKKITDIKTDFINNITHELKTPLASLSLATQMIKKQEIRKEPKKVNLLIEKIERQNIRLQKLIDQVLNNSLGYQEIKLKKETVLILNFIHQVIDDFEFSIKDKHIEIAKDIVTKNKEALIDKFYITTALLNILENAVKYGGTQIKIKTNIDKKNQFKIIISDNGIGISKKNQQLVFNKFFRIDTKEIHNVKGLGLGLYYSYQIIKAHQGIISLESVVGKGTRFSIIIPI